MDLRSAYRRGGAPKSVEVRSVECITWVAVRIEELPVQAGKRG
jgi:hypothetical protein